jgi:hypothetical protein
MANNSQTFCTPNDYLLPSRRAGRCSKCQQGKHAKCGGWMSRSHGTKIACGCSHPSHANQKDILTRQLESDVRVSRRDQF